MHINWFAILDCFKTSKACDAIGIAYFSEKEKKITAKNHTVPNIENVANEKEKQTVRFRFGEKSYSESNVK